MESKKTPVFDPAGLETPAELLDIVAECARRVLAKGAKLERPTRETQLTLLDCAATYCQQLAEL